MLALIRRVLMKPQTDTIVHYRGASVLAALRLSCLPCTTQQAGEAIETAWQPGVMAGGSQSRIAACTELWAVGFWPDGVCGGWPLIRRKIIPLVFLMAQLNESIFEIGPRLPVQR
jgi:hypothetical protein